jgi:hypothetical protein
MLDYSISQPAGILLLKPRAALRKEDFAGLRAAVDAYLAGHAILKGVLIHALDFPGWQDFAGFTAHLHFVREHHRKVERVAVVADSRLAGIVEALGKHFTSAEIRHFAFADDIEALHWLEATRGEHGVA